ncbi:hypothetical protein TL16_g08162 [Triparma laevis f. inornata]|uniref:Uncharacterized protein n=1 Tax=Triparma laevis f. inornata TaxID=1714386 RepID=A0A9W7AWA0_9STRA|nr:hypothetical protein TL16_g08162 [Triparma laevis f. inornata]
MSQDPEDPGTDKSTPFEIVAQFQHDKSITSITNLNEDTFITGDISGNIFQLKIEEVEGHIKYGEVIKGLKSVDDKLIVLSESEVESMIAVFALPLGDGEEPLKEWRGEKGMEYLSVTDEKIFTATEEVISVFDMNVSSNANLITNAQTLLSSQLSAVYVLFTSTLNSNTRRCGVFLTA